MSTSSKLSLKQAILININIMIGAGIFINSVTLSKIAGPLSPIVYAIVGLLLLPLIISIAELLKVYPGGTFYDYAKNSLGTFWGFLSAWSYFTAKLASATLMIHFSVKVIQSILPIAASINTFALDALLIGLFTFLNMANMRTGSKIQVMFMILKSIPLLFIMLGGAYTIWGTATLSNLHDLAGIPLGIPLVLYAFAGFEACCSLSRHIIDSEKNAPKAVLFSYLLVVGVYIIYQFLFYHLVGGLIENSTDFTQTIPLAIKQILIDSNAITHITALFQLAIASSALGGAYGILFSNNWNLYILAEKNHTFFSRQFKLLNKENIPYICLLAEAIICVFYVLVSQGNNIPLQQISAFGSAIAYTISVLSLLALKRNLFISICATGSCLILLAFCINAFITTNFFAFGIFSALLLSGIIMYLIKRKRLI